MRHRKEIEADNRPLSDLGRQIVESFLGDLAGAPLSGGLDNFTLEEWITIRQKVAGLDPVLVDFLRANADQFDPKRTEGDGVTLRSVGMASAALKEANSGRQEFQPGSVWVAPKLILESLLTPKMAEDLILLAKGKGLEVKFSEFTPQMTKGDIEVLGAKPGHGTARVVFTDGEGQKPFNNGTFIGKNDAFEKLSDLVQDFVSAPSEGIFSPDPEPIQGSSTRVVFTDGEQGKYAIDIEQDLPKLNLDIDEHLDALRKKFLNRSTMSPIEHRFIGDEDHRKKLDDMAKSFADAGLVKIVPAGTPGAIVFTDGEGAKYAIEGESFNKQMDEAMNEMIKNPHDPVAKQRVKDLSMMLPQGQAGKGEVWSDPLQTAKFPGKTVVIDGISAIDNALTAVLSPATQVISISLENWIDFKQKHDGIDPVLKDFVLANAEQFDPNKFEGDGVTLRSVGHASDVLRTINSGRQEFPVGSTWSAPKQILAAMLSPEMADDLIKFAKGKGLEVDTQGPKKPEAGVENDFDSPKL